MNWPGRQSRQQMEASSRRLITLVSAGRDRIIVIRRELPRTENAGCVQGRYRTERRRILLAVGRPSAPCAAAPVWFIGSPQAWQTKPAIPSYKEWVWLRRRVPSRPRAARRRAALRGGAEALQERRREWQAFRPSCRGRRPRGLPAFDPQRDGPNEAEQLPADGCYGLQFIFAGGGELLVARVQAPLRLPGNVFDLRIEALLSFGQIAAHPRSSLISPGGFHDDAAQVCISGLGDGSTLDAVTTGAFAGNQAAVAHQLPRFGEAGNRAEFADDGDGSERGHPSQGLQGGNHLADLRRSGQDRLVDGFLQPGDALGGMFHFVDVVGQGDVPGGLLKMDLAFEPLHVLQGPGPFDGIGRPHAVAAQKLAQPVARAELVLLGTFASPHQIAQGFVGGVRHKDGCQFPRTITAG